MTSGKRRQGDAPQSGLQEARLLPTAAKELDEPERFQEARMTTARPLSYELLVHSIVDYAIYMKLQAKIEGDPALANQKKEFIEDFA